MILLPNVSYNHRSLRATTSVKSGMATGTGATTQQRTEEQLLEEVRSRREDLMKDTLNCNTIFKLKLQD